MVKVSKTEMPELFCMQYFPQVFPSHDSMTHLELYQMIAKGPSYPNTCYIVTRQPGIPPPFEGIPNALGLSTMHDGYLQ